MDDNETPYDERIKTEMERFYNMVYWKPRLYNLLIENCEMKFITYYKTNRRHDVDAACPKFILDGFAESGFIIDDDNKHLTKLTLECSVDKDNPRTEIDIIIHD